jgi:hypothetical protein
LSIKSVSKFLEALLFWIETKNLLVGDRIENPLK